MLSVLAVPDGNGGGARRMPCSRVQAAAERARCENRGDWRGNKQHSRTQHHGSFSASNANQAAGNGQALY